ncbi:hypothetical protein C8A01DRAFT_21069 [Parachaetomium inaequale]|uniref:Uncharacterized protein n=1 Tax=Parachaetomium inaequale TaxID=2588326 RepID=A0AAN6P6L6_9PEZI|nr:hypothetical protein C8A01DRAFT_21069 [Parachaetomium inaequale]
MGLFERVLSWLPLKPRRKLWRLRSRLRQSFTPLELRFSLRVLRKAHTELNHSFPTARACLDLARLLFRRPWHHSCRLPPPPGEIMAYPHRQYFYTHHRTLLADRLLPLWRWRDTASRSFFRVYEGFCADHYQYVRYETEYFWYRNDPAWSPEMLPDPREFGHLAPGEEGERQLAVLASLAEALADAFNWRHMHGFRRDRNYVEPSLARGPPVYAAVFKGPAWAASVPRLPTFFELHEIDPGWKALGEDNVVSYSGDLCPFWKRNIFAVTGPLRSV